MKSVDIGIMHLSVIFLCVLCALCGLIIPIQPELILFVKPESLLLTDNKIHYLCNKPESLLLKGGGDTPQ